MSGTSVCKRCGDALSPREPVGAVYCADCIADCLEDGEWFPIPFGDRPIDAAAAGPEATR